METTGLFRGEGNLVIPYDGVSHHALGGGSYAFMNDYPEFLMSLLPAGASHTEINISVQPNCSPHFGTLCSLTLTFVLAERLQKLGLDVRVTCDLRDEAKGEQMEINGIIYQRSLRATGELEKYLPEYEDLCQILATKYGVKHILRQEKDILRQEGISRIIQQVIERRQEYGKILQPMSGVIALRADCPRCGLVDKRGVNNVYSEDSTQFSFECPHHGRFTYDVREEAHKLKFNCQLINLVLALYHETVGYGYVEVTGSDYAGFWQEQLIWRHLTKPMIIVYTPLISDWSGSKISKSLYLRKGAYDYLRAAKQEYLLSYKVFKQEQRDIGVLCQEIEKWVDEPYRLFRGYSLQYMHLLYNQKEVALGIIH